MGCRSKRRTTSRTGRGTRAGCTPAATTGTWRSEEHTSELQSRENLVCRLLLEKKKKTRPISHGEETTTMPGKVIKVLVKPGQSVKQADLLLIVEAMIFFFKVHPPTRSTL